ncbi:MAG: hypothetical protein CMJ34_00660 [Phycisphaerae bacterium]|nr:hypothetical protein [Phycisphaerae bacterium]
MPGLLTRYVAVELLKMILVTTGVLVTVIAFGATVKPLARNLLGGFDIVRYVGFACIPMLQYALPFASGFGATLVMHRIASDNEIIAMSASGLSYRRVLRPVMIIATALFLVMVLLVNYVVPIFFTRMESMLAHDVTRLLATSVDRGEAFDLGDTRIYADQVQIEEDPEGDGVERRLVLSGVAAVQSTRRGLPETEFTAEYATLDLYKVEGRSILKLVLGDATVFRSDEETLVRMPAAEPRAIDLGRRFEPNPRMMTLQRLLEVRSNPIDYWKVRTPVDALRIERAKEDLRMEIRRRIASRGTLDLEDRGRDRSWSLAITREPGSDAGRVSTVRFRDRQRVLESAVRSFTWSVTERDGIPVVDIVMDQQDSDDPDAERIPRSAQSLSLQGHEFDPDIEADTILDWASSGEETISNPDVAARVRRLLDRYVDESNHLRWNIDARIQQRTAQSMTGPLLLILGAILAILLRRSTPLMVYLAAFIPAIADILLISGGEQTLLQGPSVTGYLLIWSGNLLLLVLCLVAWRRLVRN